MLDATFWILLSFLAFTYFGDPLHRDYDERKVVTASAGCLSFEAETPYECFKLPDASLSHDRLRFSERVFHISFSAQSVVELDSDGRAHARKCHVFDSDNWVCPFLLKDESSYDPISQRDFSLILMKDGTFEERLNWADEPKKTILLSERSAQSYSNILKFKIDRILSKYFGISSKPIYSIEAEAMGWY